MVSAKKIWSFFVALIIIQFFSIAFFHFGRIYNNTVGNESEFVVTRNDGDEEEVSHFLEKTGSDESYDNEDELGYEEFSPLSSDDDEIYEKNEDEHEVQKTYPRSNEMWKILYPDLDLERHPLVSTPLKEDFFCVPPIFENSDEKYPDWVGLDPKIYSYEFDEEEVPARFLDNGDLLVTCDPKLKPAIGLNSIDIQWRELEYEGNSTTVRLRSTMDHCFVRCDGIAYVLVRASVSRNHNHITPGPYTGPHILLVLFDCISRYHVVRSMPETLKFIKEFYGSSGSSINKRRLFNFTNTNTIGVKTVHNKIGMFGGFSSSRSDENIWENTLFSDMSDDNGYLHLYGENMCFNGIVHFLHNTGFHYRIPTDAFCRFVDEDWPVNRWKEKLTEEELENLVKPYKESTKCMVKKNNITTTTSSTTGPVQKETSPNGMHGTPICMGHRYSGSLLFDYYADFRKQVKRLGEDHEHPTLAVLTTYDPHGNPANSYVSDIHVANGLRKLEEQGLFDDTIVIILSDHGQHYGGPVKSARGKIENHQWLFNMILPQEYVNTYPEVGEMLEINEDRLVTPIDLYCTLRHFPDYPNQRKFQNEYGVSLLSEPVPTERTCKSAGILSQSCFCGHWIPVDLSIVENRRTEEIFAQKTLEWINNEIEEKAPHICKYPLELNEVLGSSKKEKSRRVQFNIKSDRSEIPIFESVLNFKGSVDDLDQLEVETVIQTTVFRDHIKKCVGEIEKTKLSPHYCDCL